MNTEKTIKTSTTFTLDENVLAKIKELADKDDRSLSQFINRLLKEHIAKREAENE